MNKLILLKNKLEFIQTKESTKLDEGGYVYLIYSGGRSKIGISTEPDERIHTIKIDSPFPVFTICVRYFYSAKKVEKLLHKYYWEFRIKGEWFELTRDQIFECCDFLDLGWATETSEKLERPIKQALLLEL